MGAAALGVETHWFILAVARSNLVKRLPGGMSEYCKIALRLFYQPYDARNGIHIAPCEIVIFSQLSILLGDEGALKEMIEMKGAAGPKLCPLCQNILDHKSDLLQMDTSGFFIPSTTLDLSLIKFETNESVQKTLRYLQENKDSVSAERFGRMQQYTGFNLTESGLLLDPLLDLKPCNVLMFDWMHCYISSGIWQLEVGLLLEQLKTCNIKQDRLHTMLQEFVFPKSISSKSMTGQNIFYKKKEGESVKCSASEALSIYSVLRFVMIRLKNSGEISAIEPAVQSYLNLCRVLDLLANVKKQTTIASELQNAIFRHLQSYQDSYGVERWLPKHHMTVHIPLMYQSHKLLCACFTHERKHKTVKKFSSQATNTWAAWEKSVLMDSLREDLQDVVSRSFSIEPGLLSPGQANDEMVSTLRGLLGNPTDDVAVSLQARFSDGGRCSSKDVLLVDFNGTSTVCTAVFFSKVGENHFAYVEIWKPLGSNKFEKTTEKGFCELTCIREVCIHVKHGDRIDVVPNSCWR